LRQSLEGLKDLLAEVKANRDELRQETPGVGGPSGF
jgi:hypothetical protein